MKPALSKRLEALEHKGGPGEGEACRVVEYESAEHLDRIIGAAQAKGFPRCVIALPVNHRSAGAA